MPGEEVSLRMGMGSGSALRPMPSLTAASKTPATTERTSPTSCGSESPASMASLTSSEAGAWLSMDSRPESRRSSRETGSCRPGLQPHELSPPSSRDYAPMTPGDPLDLQQISRPESRRSSRSRQGRSQSDGSYSSPHPAIEPLAYTPSASVPDTLSPINPGLTFGSQLGRISAAGGYGRQAPRITAPSPTGQYAAEGMQHDRLGRASSDAGLDASLRNLSASPRGSRTGQRDETTGSCQAHGPAAATGLSYSTAALIDTRGKVGRGVLDRPPSRARSHEDGLGLAGSGRRSPAQQRLRLPALARPHRLPPLHPGSNS